MNKFRSVWLVVLFLFCSPVVAGGSTDVHKRTAANEATVRGYLSTKDQTPGKFLREDVVWRIVGAHTKEQGTYGAYYGMEDRKRLSETIKDRLTVKEYKTSSIEKVFCDYETCLSIHRSYVKFDNGSQPDIENDVEEVWLWHFDEKSKAREVWDYNRTIHIQMVEAGERGDQNFEAGAKQ